MAVLFLLTAATSGWAAGSAADFTLKAVQDGKDIAEPFKAKCAPQLFHLFFADRAAGDAASEQMHQEPQVKASRSGNWSVLHPSN